MHYIHDFCHLEFSLLHMDEFIDLLLREERVCDIQLPRLQVLTSIVAMQKFI